jgi:threonine dehydrogenase-like Zn-dependent dehydrogenase
LQAGETVLIHGGTSGIGTTAIMLAKAFGAKAIATAGSKEKCDACIALGADAAIDYKTQDFVAVTREKTGNKGADLIIDMVGGDYVDRNLDAAAVEVASCRSRPSRASRSNSPDQGHAEAAHLHRFHAPPASSCRQGGDADARSRPRSGFLEQGDCR